MDEDQTVVPFSTTIGKVELTGDQIQVEMDTRRKNWLRDYKSKLDLSDVLEIRNPQSVVEFIPEIMDNLRIEEIRHVYPANFLDSSI